MRSSLAFIFVLVFLTATNVLAEPQIRVSINGRVKTFPLERYVMGTLMGEVPTSWPSEVLKAQAITSRTYALKQMERRNKKPFDVQSTVMDQVFKETKKIPKSVENAVKSTRGFVLTHKGALIEAFFHASCGDHTESAKNAFSAHRPYASGAPCGFCKKSKAYSFSKHFSHKEIRKALGSGLFSKIQKARIVKKSPSGRALILELYDGKKTYSIKGTKLREKLGYNKMRSTLIDKISVEQKGLHIKGRGHGHGVGLCQWGAYGMAQSGYGAKAILQRYFKDIKITQMY